MTLSICTIAFRDELAFARVLASSLGEQGFGGRLQVLVPDDEAGPADESEPFDLLRPSELGVDSTGFHIAGVHLHRGAITAALKPSLLLAALDRGSNAVAYLDPFSQVFSPPGVLADLLGSAPAAVFPYVGGRLDGAVASADADDHVVTGRSYPGLVVVGPDARPSLEWWRSEVRFHTLRDVDGARRHLDWVDLPPAYVAASEISDPRYALGYWNADTRELEWTGSDYRVDGAPLFSFHFDGFDPARPWILSRNQGEEEPKLLLSAHPALQRLCANYAEAVIAAGFGRQLSTDTSWSMLPDGFRLTRRIREAVDYAVAAFEDGRQYALPPDPLDPASLHDFYRWLATPEPEDRQAPSTARLFHSIYRSRYDLRQAFPDLAVVDSGRFRDWAEHNAHAEYQIPQPVIDAAFAGSEWPGVAQVSWSPPAVLQPGVLVSGYLRAELGIGEAARRTIESLTAARLPCAAFSFAVTRSRQLEHPDVEVALRTDFDTNVLCINADQIGYFIRHVGAEFFDGRYTVGCSAWETEEMPVVMGRMSRFLDEIWVLSTFTATAVRATSNTPVYVFEPPVIVPTIDLTIDPRRIGMPDGFSFLFMFDFLSTIDRKNPIGLVDAFCRAFRPGEGPRLVLKAINSDRVPLDAERLRLAIGDRPDIVFIDRYLSAAECSVLLARADCYVSLHRSEGFGLTIAEAMALGKPVIATGYSGNLDFMNDEVAYLVPATRVAVGPSSPPYPPDAIWGEPDLDIAASLLRRVYDQHGEAAARGEKARQLVLSEHGMRRAVDFLNGRFREIHKKKGRREPAFSSPVPGHVRTILSIPHWTGQVPGIVPASFDP